MATDARVSQDGLEVVSQETADARVSQSGLEAITQATTIHARVSQDGLEVLADATVFNARVSQDGLEVLCFLGGSPPVTPQFSEWLNWNPATGNLNIAFPNSVAINAIWIPTYSTDIGVYANDVFIMMALGSVGSQVVPMPIGTTTVTLETSSMAPAFYVFATTQALDPRGAF